MRSTRARWNSVGLSLLLMAGQFIGAMAGEPRREPLRAGAAKVDITPDYPIRLAGFGGRRTESDGISHRIYARALAITDERGSLAMVISVDSCGIPWTMTQEVARRLSDIGLDQSSLTIVSTHTHTAPMLAGVLPTLFGAPIPEDQQQRIEQYTRELTDALEQVARQARDNMRPATLSWQVGNVGFARNRRTDGGPVDHDLPTLFVRDHQGTLIAVHTTYACHCVTLSHNMISGDWAGFAAAWMEREFPTAIALVSIGCGADANPDSGVAGDKVELAQAQGAAIADEVKRLAGGPLIPLPGAMVTTMQTIELPLDAPRTLEEWNQRASQGGAVGYHAEQNLIRLTRGDPLPDRIEYPIQTWQFGDQLAVVWLPGEVVVDYALRLKEEFGKTRLWICAYANDLPCYIPSERILREGGYEAEGAMVYYNLPQRLAAGVERLIIQEVHRQLGDRFLPLVDDDLRQSWTNPKVVPSAEAILKSFEVSPEFQVELVVAEPLVVDPVAIAFGADGALWVCQMEDYPLGMDGNFRAGGQVRRLDDTDGDGLFDTATVFIKDLPFPTGILPWRDGMLICAAPDILWARDTNGDGQADDVRQLFHGFATHNYHARVNSLRYGLDGWVYGSGGLFGGHITSFASTHAVDVTGRDFRIQPDTGLIEVVTGQTQQGRTRNDWGDWFGCDNSMLARHYPVVDHYVRRNPYVLPPAGSVPVSGEPDPGQLFGISEPTLLPLSGSRNRVTAAGGLCCYRDDLFGEEWSGDLFVCEAVGNLVHHMRLSASGATYKGHRLPAQSQSEFLASRSPWFRPVEAYSGPDGALWIVDMCRWVIEHPTWIPADMLAQMDVRAGSEQGRIFRVFPRQQKPRAIPRLSEPDPMELVASLDHANGWQRDMAMQLLIWRQARGTEQALRELARESPRPETRLQALATMDGLGVLTPADVDHALQDSHPGVLRQAIRLAERFPQCAGRLTQLAHQLAGNDLHLAQQLAWSLGEVKTSNQTASLAHLIVTYGGDRHVVAAAMSSLDRGNVVPVVREVLARSAAAVPRNETLAAELVSLAVALAPQEAIDLARAYLHGNDIRGYPDEERMERLALFLDHCALLSLSAETMAPIVDDPRIREVFSFARDAALDANRPVVERQRAIQLLGHHPTEAEQNVKVIAQLLEPHVPVTLQLAAIARLEWLNAPDAFTAALGQWNSLTPDAREALSRVMFSRSEGINALLAGLENGTVSWNTMDATRRQQLLDHPDESIRKRVVGLMPSHVHHRSQVVSDYADVAAMPGDFERGREAFRKSCANCHVLEGVGHAIGPDLAALANRSPETLLVSILDPSRDFDARYLQYLAITDDGRMLTGMLVDETSAGFTLVGQNNERNVVLRAQLSEFRATAKSLMPDGLENDLSRQELADLLVYLREIRSARKVAQGNQPRVIVAAADGQFELPASAAAIYGGDINYEEGPQSIGFWHGEQDFAEWVVEVEQAGQYEIHLEWSCAPYSAGNRMAIDVQTQQLVTVVESTGAWSTFRQMHLGNLTLPRGRVRLVVRPVPPMTRPALLDLRTLWLKPVK